MCGRSRRKSWLQRLTCVMCNVTKHAFMISCSDTVQRRNLNVRKSAYLFFPGTLRSPVLDLFRKRVFYDDWELQENSSFQNGASPTPACEKPRTIPKMNGPIGASLTRHLQSINIILGLQEECGPSKDPPSVSRIEIHTH